MSLHGNNPHFARAVLHHELIAGRSLQQFMNDRHKSYRHFHTPFWTEGWALYWEMKENNMPAEMVRAILTGQLLKKDFTTSWRFYDL